MATNGIDVMRWTVLVDNRTNDPALQTEHGLSILLETERHRILLDTGASDMLIRNAEKMGIDLCEVDYVFISHGHSDHAGGLRHFLAINDKAKIVVSPDAVSGKFYSKRGNLHSITTAWSSIPEERLLKVDASFEIADGISVIANIPQVHPKPKGNENLFAEADDGSLVPDDFRHELALYTKGFLFTGCAHSGLENILSACPCPVKEVVGGFHLLDGYESDDELTDLSKRLKTKYPDTRFLTSHCTGSHALGVMKTQMGDRLRTFCCGNKFDAKLSSYGIKGTEYPHEIDPNETNRSQAFELWMKAPNPMVTFFKTIDVTRLVRISRKTGWYKFNMLLDWCIGKAASAIREFYLLPVGDKLMQYDTLAVNTIVKNKDGGVSSCDIPFTDNLGLFNSEYREFTLRVAESCQDIDLSDRCMVIGTSAIIDTEIDGAVGMNSGIFNNPSMIWGRYRRKFFRYELPVSFQFHHTQMDGAHAGKFLSNLQEEINRLYM